MDRPSEFVEVIPDGDDEPEVDVAADQGETDWNEELSSDNWLSPEARMKLGL